MDKNKQKNLFLIYTISFLDFVAVGLLAPLIGNHLRDLGASQFIIGLAASIYSGMQVISGPLVGSWSDIRDRKSVLITTLIICSFAYALLGFTNSLPVIIALRIIIGLTKQTQSICKAVIADLLPANERPNAFGKSAASSMIGFIIAPIIGGHLSELQNGFMYICLSTSLIFILNIILACFTDNTRKPQANNTQDSMKIRQELTKSVIELKQIDWANLWDVFLLRFILGFSITLYFSQESTFLRDEFNISQKTRGYIISYFSTLGTISCFYLNKITDHFYSNDEYCLNRLTHFFALMSVSLVCLALAPNIYLYLLFLAPFGMASALLRIVSMELMLKKASSDHRGSLSGTCNSIMSISRFVTPVSSGLIVDKLGINFAMLFAGFPPLIGAVLASRLWDQDKEKVE